jgi:hypothetical protein
MLSELWYVIGHQPLMGVLVLAIAAYLVCCVLAVYFLWQSNRLKHLAEEQKMLDRRLRYRGGGQSHE